MAVYPTHRPPHPGCPGRGASHLKTTALDKPGRAATLRPQLPAGQTHSLWTLT